MLKQWIVIMLGSLILMPVTMVMFAQQRPLSGDRTDNAPKVGEMAPTFKLKSLDGNEEFDLEAYRGKEPVVLLFGSYT